VKMRQSVRRDGPAEQPIAGWNGHQSTRFRCIHDVGQDQAIRAFSLFGVSVTGIVPSQHQVEPGIS
jgi:hypothetical protein